MTTKIKIRGYHTDSFAHVNNARYLEFLEEDRWQLLEQHMDLGDFLASGFMLFVVNINISYISQARINDLVIVRSGLGRIGNKSMVIEQEVFNQTTGQICASALVTFVVTDENGKPIKIEGELKDDILSLPALKE